MRRENLYAVIFLMLAILLAFYASAGGYWLLAVWPAFAFAIVSCAYATRSAKPFCKRTDGTRSPSVAIALAPYTYFALGTWYLQLYLSREKAYARINETLFISRRLLATELPSEVKRICDLTSEFTDPAIFRAMDGYVCYPILDASACEAVKLITLAKALPPSVENPLLVHCANGHGRTGMFAAIWLLAHGFAFSPTEAVRLIQAARPHAKLGREQYATVEKAFDILESSFLI